MTLKWQEIKDLIDLELEDDYKDWCINVQFSSDLIFRVQNNFLLSLQIKYKEKDF